jgi:anti-sigma regulatory factor (Ser/Thr protein kinase)
LERVFPGDPAVGSLLRAVLAKFLQPCPAADDVITLTWELAANAIGHSDSGLPGGQFTITIHDFPATTSTPTSATKAASGTPT